MTKAEWREKDRRIRGTPNTCGHPDREHEAHGMCKRCYRKNYLRGINPRPFAYSPVLMAQRAKKTRRGKPTAIGKAVVKIYDAQNNLVATMDPATRKRTAVKR